MRCAPPSSVWMTMVMRETPGVSLCPTASEMMLRLRRRECDATRFSTPGRSSTYTVKICIFMGPSLHVRAGLDNRVRPANHRMQVGAGRHHRIDGIFLFHSEVDDHRTGVIARLLDRGVDFASFGDAN